MREPLQVVEDHDRLELRRQLGQRPGETASQLGPFRVHRRARAAGRGHRHVFRSPPCQVLAPVEGGIDQQAVEPGPERAARLERVDPLQGAYEGVVHEVLRVLHVLEEPVGDGERLIGVAFHESGEGLAVATLGAGDQPGLVAGRA